MSITTRDVKSLSKSGSAKLKGDVTLSQGTNITLTQTGQDIAIAAAGGSADGTFLKYRIYGTTPNRWHTSHIGNGQSNTVMTANTMDAIPFATSQAITLDRIGIYVTTGVANTNARLGIYSDNGSYYPGALLLDAGTVSTATSSTVVTITISQVLSANSLYWLVANYEGAPTIKSLNTSFQGVFGWNNGLLASQQGYQVTRTYSALPDPFTASGLMIQFPTSIWVRILS